MAKIETRERPTEVIPVTTMVEVPVLTEEERAEFMATIREAEEDIRAGRAQTFTADEFDAWISQRAQEIRARKRSHGV